MGKALPASGASALGRLNQGAVGVAARDAPSQDQAGCIGQLGALPATE
ncbi:hypothetical protein T1E_3396 [Pseudomonas putida DOT-T1E]|uniref:Uncharacterized protein n=1 Tax=Pseudomonas putida (strain DOT-T1E) TaxID=1196325 RepID=I7BYI2_PSEPT|nr:hypothetical protein T1E_3396 [Pseudomonas putida DOT-T1E]